MNKITVTGQIKPYTISYMIQLTSFAPNILSRRPGFEARSGDVGFVVDKVAMGQVFSEYFGFPCQF
jgi:hypothetical protein